MYYTVQLVREATIKNDTYQKEECLPLIYVYAHNEKALYEKIDKLLAYMPGVIVEYVHLSSLVRSEEPKVYFEQVSRCRNNS